MIDLPKLNENEQERIEEIKFYLFVTKIKKLAIGAGLDSEYTILDPLIELSGCSKNLLNAAIVTATSISCKPHDLEIAVAMKSIGMPFRIIQERVMYYQKYRTNLLTYVRERPENLLLPKCPKDITDVIIEFNKQMHEKVAWIYRFLDQEIKQQGSYESWDC